MGSNREDFAEKPLRRDVFLFSHPRTLSSLLFRLLSRQPGWDQSSYHFQEPFIYAIESFRWRPLPDIPAEQHKQFTRLIQNGIDKLQNIREAAIREDRSIFVKNHTIQIWEPSRPPLPGIPSSPTKTNPTLVPDDFLVLWQPLFLIRHPALVIESWYRAESRVGVVDVSDKCWDCCTSLGYSRQLYDWYAGKAGDPATTGHSFAPIVVDADDILEDGCVEKLCDMCNMDRNLIKYEWDAATPSDDNSRISRRFRSYMRGLWNSTSIDTSKTSRGLCMAEKLAGWRDEFGVTVADALHSLVEDAMPDYEYLRECRFWGKHSS